MIKIALSRVLKPSPLPRPLLTALFCKQPHDKQPLPDRKNKETIHKKGLAGLKRVEPQQQPQQSPDAFLKPFKKPEEDTEVTELRKKLNIRIEQAQLQQLADTLEKEGLKAHATAIRNSKEPVAQKQALLRASVAFPAMACDYREVFDSMVKQAMFLPRHSYFDESGREGQQFIQMFKKEVYEVMRQVSFQLGVFMRSYVRLCEQSWTGFFRLRRVVGEVLVQGMCTCELSSAENVGVIQFFVESLQGRTKMIWLDHEIMEQFICQLAFFPDKPLIQVDNVLSFNKRIVYALNRNSLRTLLQLMTIRKELLFGHCAEGLLFVAGSLIHVGDKLSEEFGFRDQVITEVLLEGLRGWHGCSFRWLSRYLRIVGSNLLVDDYRKDFQTLFPAFILRSLRAKNDEQEQTSFAHLEELLLLLLDQEILLPQQLEALRKEFIQESANPKKQHSLQECLSRVLSSGRGGITFNNVRRMRTVQIYQSLVSALRGNRLQEVQVILTVILDPKVNQYHYTLMKGNKFLQAQGIFDQAIHYLYHNEQWGIFLNIFLNIFHKMFHRHLMIGQIITSIKNENQLSASSLWNQYYKAWIIFNGTLDAPENKARFIRGLFNTLITYNHTFEQQDLLINPHFYHALQLASPQQAKDYSTLLNYYQLIDYLLTEEQNNKLISPLLYPIASELTTQIDNSIHKELPNLKLKLLKFTLRYNSILEPPNTNPLPTPLKQPQKHNNQKQQPPKPNQHQNAEQDEEPISLNQMELRLLSILNRSGRAETSPTQPEVKRLLPILKENLPVLLFQMQEYSEQGKNAIWELLNECKAHELAEILSCAVGELISVKGQRRVWQLLLDRGEELQTVVWKPLMFVFHKKPLFRGYVQRLGRQVLQQWQSKSTLMNLGSFRQLTLALMSTGLLEDRKLVQPIFQRQVQAALEYCLSGDEVFLRFRPYLLKGYQLPLKAVESFLCKIAGVPRAYQILFAHEPLLGKAEFSTLLQKFLKNRQAFLESGVRAQNSIMICFLENQYPEESQAFREFNLKQRKEGRKEEGFGQQQLERIKTLLLSRYRGISLLKKCFLHVNNSIVIITDSLSGATKIPFYERVLGSLGETKQKAVKVVSINETMIKSSVVKSLQVQLNLKPKVLSRGAGEELQGQGLQQQLAQEINQMDPSESQL